MSAATTTPHTPWPTVKLGDVCEVARGGSPRPIKSYITQAVDGLNWIKIGDVSPNGKYIEKTAEKIKPSGLNKTRQVAIGDFLLSNSMSFGRPYILKIDGCIHDGWLVLRGFRDVLEENFFYYLLRTEYVQSQFDLHASGSTVRNLNTKSVESVLIPLPPLEVQREIVAKVEAGLKEADGLVAHFKRLAALADDTFKAELDETFNALSAPTVKLGDVCETCSGGTPLRTMREYYEDGDIPWLRSGEVCQKDIVQTEMFITQKGVDNSSAKKVPINTVVVAMYGATAGQVGILRIESTTNQAVCGILPSEKHLPEFLYYQLLSMKNVMVSQAQGGAQPNISQIKIKNLEIKFPSLDEQARIVARLEAAKARCEQLKGWAERGLKAAEALRKAVLAEAFEQ